MVPWMNFPDTLDVADVALGERPTGNYSGMMTLARKISGALGVGMIGWILTGVGYDKYLSATKALESLVGEEAFKAITAEEIGARISENAAAISDKLVELHAADPSISYGFDVSALNVDSVLLTIRLLMGIAVAVLISIAFIGSFRFKLNNTILGRMRYFSDKVKAGEFDALTDEEKAERADLIKTHYGKYDAEADAKMVASVAEKAKNADGEND